MKRFKFLMMIGLCITLIQTGIFQNKVYAASAEDWTFTVNEDGNTLTITGYKGNEANVAVPASIDGKAVTKLTGYNYEAIKQISLPETIESIDTSIFYRGLIEEIDVDGGNDHYKSVGGVLFSADLKQLIAYPMGNQRSAYHIPQGTETIVFNAFSTTIYNGPTALEDVFVPKA